MLLHLMHIIYIYRIQGKHRKNVIALDAYIIIVKMDRPSKFKSSWTETNENRAPFQKIRNHFFFCYGTRCIRKIRIQIRDNKLIFMGDVLYYTVFT